MMGLLIAFIIFTANYNNSMGIFDFFKKKNSRQENVSTPVQKLMARGKNSSGGSGRSGGNNTGNNSGNTFTTTGK
jgi:hypothetical protein